MQNAQASRANGCAGNVEFAQGTANRLLYSPATEKGRIWDEGGNEVEKTPGCVPATPPIAPAAGRTDLVLKSPNSQQHPGSLSKFARGRSLRAPAELLTSLM